MASFLQLSVFSLLLLLFSLSKAQSTSKPNALLLPISKDASTLQYITRFSLGTPLVPRRFVLDLGGESLWMTCETGYKSSTYKPGLCGMAACSVAKANGCFKYCFNKRRPGCNNNSCILDPENTVIRRADLQFGSVAIDTISLQSTDGSRSGPSVTIPSFIFACAPDSLLERLASGIKGMAGLGRNRITLPTQISSSFGGSFRRKFAICLPSTAKSTGVVLFGDSPYNFYASYNKSKRIDITERFQYTKLYINPISTASAYVRGEPSTDYFVAIKSITVNRKPIAINATLLSFNNNRAIGGSKISTVDPYTVLHSSIYKALVEAFAAELKALNVAKVAPVGKFRECFSTKILSFTLLGYSVPDIGFVFEGQDVVWELQGANSMVQINRDVVCLGFVDGGLRPRTSIVIGAHQIEDNLLQFDLAASRFGFSSTLLWVASECGNFKL